jgi:hypothetical protein
MSSNFWCGLVFPYSLGLGRTVCVMLVCLLIVGVGWLLFFVVCWRGRCMSVCVCDVVETSYEGHMVDALASRADEGRWSLR